MGNENKTLIILWIFMLVLGVFICQIFFALYKNNADFVKKSSITEATIVNKSKNSKIIPIYEYTIKYQINNQTYNGIINSFFNYQINDKMTIFYETANPNWIMEQKATWRHLVLFLLSLLFPLYILFQLFIYFGKLITAKIMRKNDYVIADIIKVEPNNNNHFSYYLRCQYQNVIYDSSTITTKQYNYIKDNDIRQVKLYFDNKGKYYIDIDSIYRKKVKKC